MHIESTTSATLSNSKSRSSITHRKGEQTSVLHLVHITSPLFTNTEPSSSSLKKKHIALLYLHATPLLPIRQEMNILPHARTNTLAPCPQLVKHTANQLTNGPRTQSSINLMMETIIRIGGHSRRLELFSIPSVIVCVTTRKKTFTAQQRTPSTITSHYRCHTTT